jgi:hypothetical protein
MATFTFFDEFKGNLGLGLFDLNGDTYKAVLTNTAPDAADDDTLSDITQIANGNGYTTDGVTLTGTGWAETGAGTGIWELTCDNFSWTASAGTMASFQYVVVNDVTADKLVGYIDVGSTVSLTVGNSFTANLGSGRLFVLQSS